MQFRYDENDKITEVILSEDDICYNCYIDDKCPLIGAYQYGLAYPSADKITISYCEIKV